MGQYGNNRNGIKFLSKPRRGKKGRLYIHPTKQRGNNAENRFYEAFKKSNFDYPYYYVSIRRATREEDMAGADFFIKMREEIELPVNVKCSHRGVKHYRNEQNKSQRVFVKTVLAFAALDEFDHTMILTSFFLEADKWRKIHIPKR